MNRPANIGHAPAYLHRLCWVAVACFLACAASLAEDSPVPALKHYATDLTGTLSADQIAQLDQELSSFDKTTSTQIVLLMIPSLNGEDLEEYSLRVAEANHIGKKGKDNGALLLVARDDRKARIEVGYGLEGSLPDALAGQIIRKELSPRFRQGDYYGGLRAGVEAIMAATKDEYQADPSSSRGKGNFPPVLFAVLALAFLILRITRRRRGIFFGGGPWIGGGWGGGSGGGFGGGGGFSGGGGSFGGGGASGGW